ncbi:MAG TPA: hypothetical protein PKC03_04030 [Dokdonella sp.]|nr:hypothetical protein [Dokdonella sp.]
MANDVNINVSVWLKEPGKPPENTDSFKNVIFGFEERSPLPLGVVLHKDGTIDISDAANKLDIKFYLKTKLLCDEQGSICTDYGVSFKPVVVGAPYQTSARQLMWIAPGENPPIGEWPSTSGFSSFKHNVYGDESSMSVSINRKELTAETYSYSLAVLATDTKGGKAGALVRDDPQIKNGTTHHFFPPYLLPGLLLGIVLGALGTAVAVLLRDRNRSRPA